MANLIDSAKTQIDELLQNAYRRASAAGALPAGCELTGSVEIGKTNCKSVDNRVKGEN